MNTTFKTHIKPLMLYSGEVLTTASNLVFNKLELAQNCVLCLIRVTAIQALKLYTGHLPITTEIKQVIISISKIKALTYTNWTKEVNGQQHLKPK